MIVPSFAERLLHRLHLLPTPIMDGFANVLFGRVLPLAVRRGILEAVAGRERSSGDIASQVMMSSQAVALLCDALVETGYLRRRGDCYGTTAAARKWLLRASPFSLCHFLAYCEILHARWQDLEDAYEQGTSPHPYAIAFNEMEWETYVLGMRDLARVLLPRVMPQIRPPADARTLLDLGGSHALYGMAMCRRHPGLGVTVMDYPGPLAVASRLIAQAGLQHRFTLCPGDLRLTDFPVGQDLIFMFNLLHGFDTRESAGLLRRAIDALNIHGRLYILDQFREGRGRTPIGRFIPLMVGLNLLNESGGMAHRIDDVRAWCGKEAVVRVTNVRIPGVSLVEVRRRAEKAGRG